MVRVANFCGFKYDVDKYEKIMEDIDNGQDFAILSNESAEEEEGRYNKYKVCSLCGRVIVHDKFGFGCKCYETIKSLIGIVEKISPDFAETLSQHRLNTWILYSRVIRSLYVSANSNEDGTFKNFRSDFKKSFVPSIAKAERISKKQVEIMIRELANNDYYSSGCATMDYNDKLEVIKSDRTALEQFAESWLTTVNSPNGVVDFARITYKNAWIDNPLKTSVKFD